jgi:glycerophosphoryl diester phosphodiesterase
MTKIIGHRGAAALALENSKASLEAAIKHKVDVIEFDVRLTKDERLVVLHDSTTRRVAATEHDLHELTAAEASEIELHNGQRLMSLDEALDIVGSKPIIIDIKDSDSVEELITVLERHPKARFGFASLHHNELRLMRQAFPEAPVYVLEHFSPVEIIQSARHIHATGIGLNKWLMNPLTYLLAKRHNLELYLYTVNAPWLMRFLLRLYPGISICTDNPKRLIRTLQ